MDHSEYPQPFAKRRRVSPSNSSSSQDELSELPLPTRRSSTQQTRHHHDTNGTAHTHDVDMYDDQQDAEDELSHDTYPLKQRPIPLPLSPAISTPTLQAPTDLPSAPDSDYYTDAGAFSPAPAIPSSPQPDPAPATLRYKPKLILRGHKRAVTGVKLSPDGKMIASCCTLILLNSVYIL